MYNSSNHQIVSYDHNLQIDSDFRQSFTMIKMDSILNDSNHLRLNWYTLTDCKEDMSTILHGLKYSKKRSAYVAWLKSNRHCSRLCRRDWNNGKKFENQHMLTYFGVKINRDLSLIHDGSSRIQDISKWCMENWRVIFRRKILRQCTEQGNLTIDWNFGDYR